MSHSTSTTADPLLELSKRKGASGRTFVVPEVRVMFVQLNKNACTSLKWMIAGIAGEDLDGFGPSLQASTSLQDDIHDRNQWMHVPMLERLNPEVRAQIHPDNGWFIFGVTRDPRSRLFSAWQSKLLLENPGYARYAEQPWYPRHPVSVESVAEDFERYVTHLERVPTPGLRNDGHFRDQVDLLSEDLVTYSEIYDLRELGRLQADLRVHLDSVGFTGQLELPRLNDTPLRANAVPFAAGVLERVDRLYQRDFERFPGRWNFAAIEKVPAWTTHQLAEVDHLAEYGRRLGYLLNEARNFRTELKKERDRSTLQQKRADDLQRQLASATAKAPGALAVSLRRRVRRAASIVRRYRPAKRR